VRQEASVARILEGEGKREGVSVAFLVVRTF